MRKTQKREAQRGIALLTVLLFLVLLSAMAVGLMYMSTTETQINSNFRAEQTAYFAAKAGMEELRDRMMASNVNTIVTTTPLPATYPDKDKIIYMINEGSNPGSVQPNLWTLSSQFADTDLCHDGYGLTGTVNVPCNTFPSGSPTLTDKPSRLPFHDTSAALSFKWARVSWKQGNSNQLYAVNGTSSQPVCWNGTYEQLLPAGTTSCTSMTPSLNPVYLLTALAVTNTGARKMVQAEVALQPAQPFPYGLFATGNGCGAVTLGGGGGGAASVDSFSSANGAYSPTNSSKTGGDVGSNGNTLVNGGSTIGGSVGSPLYPPLQGDCPSTLSINGNSGGGMITGTDPKNQLLSTGTVTIPTPIIPAAPTGTENLPTCPSGKGVCLSPGNYGDIKISGGTSLTLAAGVYNINSISLAGQSTLTITGAVTLNVQGTGQNTPVDLSGGTLANTTMIASNFQVNYAGTGTVKISGGDQSYLVVDAPNANVQLVGNSDIFGAIVGNTIAVSGGARFHYDKNTSSPVPSSSYYSLLSFRELYY